VLGITYQSAGVITENGFWNDDLNLGTFRKVQVLDERRIGSHPGTMEILAVAARTESFPFPRPAGTYFRAPARPVRDSFPGHGKPVTPANHPLPRARPRSPQRAPGGGGRCHGALSSDLEIQDRVANGNVYTLRPSRVSPAVRLHGDPSTRQRPAPELFEQISESVIVKPMIALSRGAAPIE